MRIVSNNIKIDWKIIDGSLFFLITRPMKARIARPEYRTVKNNLTI